MSTTVQRLGPDDAATYHALRIRGMREHPDAFTSSAQEEADRPLQWAQERLRAAPGKPHDFFLGAFIGATLVGIVGLQGRYRPKERHNATLVGMYVAPQAAGSGVGRALMGALLAECSALDVLTQLDLTVTEGNLRAQGLYAAHGFQVWGTQPRAVCVDGRYLAKVHMGLQLR